jgi:hypothetical protein
MSSPVTPQAILARLLWERPSELSSAAVADTAIRPTSATRPMATRSTTPTPRPTELTAPTALLITTRPRVRTACHKLLTVRTGLRLALHPTILTLAHLPELHRPQLPTANKASAKRIPPTGTYGATHQGSSPTAQWGQSYVSSRHEGSIRPMSLGSCDRGGSARDSVFSAALPTSVAGSARVTELRDYCDWTRGSCDINCKSTII